MDKKGKPRKLFWSFCLLLSFPSGFLFSQLQPPHRMALAAGADDAACTDRCDRDYDTCSQSCAACYSDCVREVGDPIFCAQACRTCQPLCDSAYSSCLRDCDPGFELVHSWSSPDEVRSVAWWYGLVASGSKDGTIQVWHDPTNALVWTLRGPNSPVNSLAWSPSYGWIVSGLGFPANLVKIWNAASGREFPPDLTTGFPVLSVAWSSYDTRVGRTKIAAGLSNGMVRIWNADRRTQIGNDLSGPTVPVNSVAWSPDSNRIAVGYGYPDNRIRIWDANTGVVVKVLEEPLSDVLSVAWSPDGSRIASGSSDRKIMVWQVDTWTLIQTLLEDDYVNSVAWSPDSTRIVSGLYNSAVKVWQANTGALLHTFAGHVGAVWSVAWSSDGKRIASGSSDRTTKIWNAETIRAGASHSGKQTVN